MEAKVWQRIFCGGGDTLFTSSVVCTGPVPAEPTFEWTHDHMWAPDSAYGFYCRKLYERFADKYPDISPQDWDICISYIAATAGGNSTPFNVSGHWSHGYSTNVHICCSSWAILSRLRC